MQVKDLLTYAYKGATPHLLGEAANIVNKWETDSVDLTQFLNTVRQVKGAGRLYLLYTTHPLLPLRPPFRGLCTDSKYL